MLIIIMYVLILVVMEEGQRQQGTKVIAGDLKVLILVVMEEGQRLHKDTLHCLSKKS